MGLVITKTNFETEVLQSDIPVMVDFYADWCGPCKMFAPTVDALTEEYAGRIKVGKCNIDEEMELANDFRIMSIPTVVIFKGGQAVETIVGSLPKKSLADKLEQVL